MTLRVVSPELLETKLAELELGHSYTVDVNIRRQGMPESEMELLLHEYKQDCGHILFEKEE